MSRLAPRTLRSARIDNGVDRRDQSGDASALGYTPDPTCVMRLDGEPRGPSARVVSLAAPPFDLLDACFTNGRDAYRRFLWIQVERYAAMIASGFGRWLAITLGDETVATCGVFPHPLPCSRFQLVAVHPAHRNRGLASTLVASVCRETSGPSVIGCVPESQAERIFARIGFTKIEHTIAICKSST